MAAKTYAEIKKECLQQKRLFEDPEFLPVEANIHYDDTWKPSNIVWKRPPEFCENPKFIDEGTSRFDVDQGTLGDCWFNASLANVSECKSLIQRVAPPNQSFSTDYCGVFRFNFWVYGKWTEVVVDDRLPVRVKDDRPAFMHSSTTNEFWSPLLEKAYAKLNGCYQALKGGQSSEALEDFTGGLSQTFSLQDKTPSNLFRILTRANRISSLISISTNTAPTEQEEKYLRSVGLPPKHAYSVTDVRKFEVQRAKGPVVVRLIRVRNPWGNAAEWTGDWSDKSPLWNDVPEDFRNNELGLVTKGDGEFWMSYEDLTKNFLKLTICYLDAESLVGGKEQWRVTKYEGNWKKNTNAGGNKSNPTFWTNPHYRFKVVDPDDDDNEKRSTVIVAVMQCDRRKLRAVGLDYFTIGYYIYSLKGLDSDVLDKNFFSKNQPVVEGSFAKLREVVGQHSLAPGRYVLIPCTKNDGEEARYLIRLYTEKRLQ